MSNFNESLRKDLDSTVDKIEMASFNQGYEAAINAIDEISNGLHNDGEKTMATVLDWLSKELRGENC